MSILEFRIPKKGNVKEGGILRAAGEGEGGTKSIPGKIVFSQEEEGHRQQEMGKLIDFLTHTELFDKKWKARDVLVNPKVQKDVAKKLGWEFRPEKLNEYLEILAAQGK
ncbi:MAG: hypothetical protein WCT22_05535 [Patescibacteria group bacterium]|jgi:hypothetical protein